MSDQPRHFAIVTGASSGIGLELAKLAAADNHDLLIAADRPLDAAAAELRELGAMVETIQVDLSTVEGVDQLFATARTWAGRSTACSPTPARVSARRSSTRTGTTSWVW